jgi:uncharacterized LabA/DUF88 family protein
MNRVNFLIDGFNVYHSILDAYRLKGLKVKWLDLNALCRSYLYLFGKDSVLSGIDYFSAYAHHIGDTEVIKRHETFINALKSIGVNTHLGRFKERETRCPLSGKYSFNGSPVNCPINGFFIRHEEKETDVAIAVKLCDLISRNECDTCVLVTGDTDLVPAVEYCNTRYPEKRILFAFPFNRRNTQLKELAPNSFSISANKYSQHQFPNPIHLPDGKLISKPHTW